MKNITIAGNVGQSELKDAGGTPLLAFSVAVRDGKDSTLWFDCGLFGKRAQVLSEYVQKGSYVTVGGDLRTHEAQNGKTYLKVHVSDITLGPKRESKPAESTTQELTEDQIPW